MNERLEQLLKVIVEPDGKPVGADIMKSTSELDRILKENRSELDARLIHFLEGRSYSKALDWVRGGRNQPSGNCSK